MASNYYLKVTAGPNYTEQHPLSINTEQPTRITSDHLTANLVVRIQNYRGLDVDGKPSEHKTSPYFSKPPHQHDLYSIQFSFTLKEDVNAHDLVFGNDFDHAIRDRLPPGFQQAFNIVKWFIDPGLYGDVNADKPYLYGPLLSSINTFRVGPKDDREQEKIEETRANQDSELSILSEGGDADGAQLRKDAHIPPDAAARKKYFLTESHLKAFTFEKGREYSNDFFNPYLDFNEFALKLPGFGVIPGITMPILRYWDGQPLRYTLRKRGGDVLMVVMFTLVPREEVEGEGAKEEVEGKKGGEPAAETADDDVD
ncbi:hypothetical protein BAUCODRAFT_73688 [Baudoinia panamericana UAMH 10762]|uniref:Domain of unknown function at the cortex 1 domain-containing protein n=1 Tax=Baudoinia panamericana (strain UAMH 10762) TaxID=717646 RepID=M2MCV1_BAUPA|nr:uncharacterized protein BAUCODRAFT_73688 [Baudoinia panamericana UAMH 10762]EMC94366.1 hypothetical protein BAUCODRAFT_73688 [Baudoinia panamericana UAMH 10762]